MLGVRKVCCPAWVPWCAQLIILPVWIWLTYDVLFSSRRRAALGVTDWALVSFVLVVVSLFLFLAGYRKLPGPAAENAPGGDK
ncbi:MAG: hypothetical protein JSW46_12905 [Gemmatimonadota bacterium]|nr:MAG: hypothetical protein JSW46_12905 [Gemmatimonadota bacterium]